MNKKKKIDLVIVGGGAAGLMAAFWAKRKGGSVLVLEKNKPGLKILASGNGRCNFTNKTTDLKKLIKNYEPDGRFLYRSFKEFGPEETIDFFESRGVKAKSEGSKIFPESDNAEDVLSVFKEELRDEIKYGRVVGFEADEKEIKSVLIESENRTEKIKAKNFLLATGGMSYSHLGADGSGFQLAEEVGHKIVRPTPALTPIISKDQKISDLQGVSLRDVEVAVGKDRERGDLIFTHFGVSGPSILNLSLRIKDLQRINLNLFPDLGFEEIDNKLRKALKGGKSLKNSLSKLFPESFVVTFFSEFKLPQKGNQVTKKERKDIVRKITNIKVEKCKLAGFERALVTKGGVRIDGIDSKTMRSKIMSNLFFAGEVINIAGKTGGFNLQMCWSTGRLAGIKAVEG